MSVAIPDLWSEDIKVDVLTPLAILKAQASNLAPRTKGVLDAEVVTAETHTRVSHRLQLIAPALGGYRRTILDVRHDRPGPYPATIDAECFRRDDPDHQSDPDDGQLTIAWTYQELLEFVKQALQSKQVRSVIQSLIARSNEPIRDPESGPTDQPEADKSA